MGSDGQMKFDLTTNSQWRFDLPTCLLKFLTHMLFWVYTYVNLLSRVISDFPKAYSQERLSFSHHQINLVLVPFF